MLRRARPCSGRAAGKHRSRVPATQLHRARGARRPTLGALARRPADPQRRNPWRRHSLLCRRCGTTSSWPSICSTKRWCSLSHQVRAATTRKRRRRSQSRGQGRGLEAFLEAPGSPVKSRVRRERSRTALCGTAARKDRARNRSRCRRVPRRRSRAVHPLGMASPRTASGGCRSTSRMDSCSAIFFYANDSRRCRRGHRRARPRCPERVRLPRVSAQVRSRRRRLDGANSALVLGIYDGVFAFERGDNTIPAGAPFPPYAKVEAGNVMHAGIRTRNKGASLWKMQAGMGDTVFAPLYERADSGAASSSNSSIESSAWFLRPTASVSTASRSNSRSTSRRSNASSGATTRWCGRERPAELARPSLSMTRSSRRRPKRSRTGDLEVVLDGPVHKTGRQKLKVGVDFDAACPASLARFSFHLRRLIRRQRRSGRRWSEPGTDDSHCRRLQLWWKPNGSELGWEVVQDADPSRATASR